MVFNCITNSRDLNKDASVHDDYLNQKCSSLQLYRHHASLQMYHQGLDLQDTSQRHFSLATSLLI